MQRVVSGSELEQTLKNFSRVATRVREESDRSIWQFASAGRAYRLHFYPRRSTLSRLLRGNGATREFAMFQRLQKAKIASPRAISLLIGFSINDVRGDAVVLEAVEPAVDLETLLTAPRILPGATHRLITRGVISVVQELARSGLRAANVSMKSFAVLDGKVMLSESAGLRRGLPRLNDLIRLAREFSPFATRCDLYRGWLALGPDLPPPRERRMRRFVPQAATIEQISIGEWSGLFTRRARRSRPWSPASATTIEASDWQRAWPSLLAAVRESRLDAIKRGDSGDVLSAEIELGDRRFASVLKIPRRKFWWRYLTELGRGSRAKRTWIKTWKMLDRDVPTEWPMLLLERCRLGYPIESILVFERVSGETLAAANFDSIEPKKREMLFFRAGRLLRQIESLGFTHADAKSTNWIVFNDPLLGPSPILIDVDGVRHYRWSMLGMERLLRAMKQHPQYTPGDSLELCRGFAPRAKFVRDDAAAQDGERP